MTLSSSPAEVAPLISLAVYCPLLSQDKEERAQDSILFFFPAHADMNRQMNQVGFCIAMSSLAVRFGVQNSNRQTICKQRSSVCLCSPVANLWASAHVHGGYGEAEATHQLLQLSFALFELLYSHTALHCLTEQLRSVETAETEEELSGELTDPATPHMGDILNARTALQSFFAKCAVFISDVLVAQQRTLANRSAAAVPPSTLFHAFTPTQWAQYLCGEATFGFPLHHVDARAVPRERLGSVEDVVHRMLWSRACAHADVFHELDELPRCCVFSLPSLSILMADNRLPSRVLQTFKYYLMLYAPITSSSFRCHLPDEKKPCDVAVWLEGDILVVLIEAQRPQTVHATHTNDANPSGLPSASLLECASAICTEVLQLTLRSLYGLTTPVKRDAYWLSTSDMIHHEAQYTTLTLSRFKPGTSTSSSSNLILHLRFVGRVVKGNASLFALWPGLIEHIRIMMHTTKLTMAAAPADGAVWECWTWWGSVWIFLRFTGSAVQVLAWHSPVNYRQLFYDAKHTLLLAS